MFYLFLLKFLWASWDFKSLHQLLEGGGSGNWSKGDTRLFLNMILCGIFALTLSFSPIFLISKLQPFSAKVDNILYFSSLLIFFVSYIALFKFIPANWRDPDFSKKKKVIIFVGSFIMINLFIQFVWLLDFYNFGIKLFYYNIIFFMLVSFFFFTRLMLYQGTVDR
tara:strand:+ start:593 stop:1090 length:498 start_codon:yes stop_codon:yes gene_type:complete